jgi:hypothetical protein
MPPRRHTFYLADATILSNPKFRRLARGGPDWISCVGAFHILIGVATLEGSPYFTDEDIEDILGTEAMPWVVMLRKVGLMTATGLDPDTFEDWRPKARPRYPSDGVPGSQTDSDGVGGITTESPHKLPRNQAGSGGVGFDSNGIGTDSDGIPTSTSSSSSGSTTQSAPPSGSPSEFQARVPRPA